MHVMAALKEKNPSATVITHDLAAQPLPHISPQWVAAAFGGNNDAPELALSKTLIAELKASDVLVIEAPMYNFGIPSALKAWIDHVVRAGHTFQYGASGPEGLVKTTRAILVISRGGIYSEGAMQAFNHQDTYVRAVLGFIGITDIESIMVEGVAFGPEQAKAAVEAATARVAQVTARKAA